MSSTNFDIAIIGAGAAGLHLALAMKNEPSFKDKRILILEKTAKDQNDRTWCFWEKSEGKWDQLLRQSWSQGLFYTTENTIPLSLPPLRYKMLRAIDFYEFAMKEIAASPNFLLQKDDVKSVENGAPFRINGTQGTYTAEHVFDSRIPEDFFRTNDKYTRIKQHFKGWVIRTPDDRFDPSSFTMMDFRLLWPGSTSFSYVLPLNKREALIEFTLFSPELLKDGDYDHMLQRYISEILQLQNFEIVEHERGVIPMSDFPFEKYSRGKHVNIGTAGGWVKPSSGYAFKNCERNALKIVENLKAGKPADRGLISAKFRLYDSIFLDVLNRQNAMGPKIFENMYLKNDVQKIFAFLDDQTSFAEDVKIILGFSKSLFLRSLLNYFIR